VKLATFRFTVADRDPTSAKASNFLARARKSTCEQLISAGTSSGFSRSAWVLANFLTEFDFGDRTNVMTYLHIVKLISRKVG